VFCNLLCISTSYFVSLRRRPQGWCGGGARIKACTEISVTAFTKFSISVNRAGCTGNKPHDDISQLQARKHRPNAARCRRRQTHMARNVGKSSYEKPTESGFYVSVARAPGLYRTLATYPYFNGDRN